MVLLPKIKPHLVRNSLTGKLLNSPDSVHLKVEGPTHLLGLNSLMMLRSLSRSKVMERQLKDSTVLRRKGNTGQQLPTVHHRIQTRDNLVRRLPMVSHRGKVMGPHKQDTEQPRTVSLHKVGRSDFQVGRRPADSVRQVDSAVVGRETTAPKVKCETPFKFS